MGLFSWLSGARKGPAVNPGPDASGLYSRLPKGAKWGPGPDPAGDPIKFVPGRGDLYFDLVEWGWQDRLKSAALIRSPDGVMGFGFVLALSDGSTTDSAESYSLAAGSGQLRDRQKVEWVIPKGHPTRLATLVSLGEPTTNLVRFLEKCFGLPNSGLAAIPGQSGINCAFVILQGRVVPDRDLFTARCKFFLAPNGQEGDGRYAEFFLNINSVTKKLWISQKAAAYQAPILNWVTGQAGGMPAN
jgi:hypothetical protein